MIYPDFLQTNDVVGICAPSAGVGDKLLDLDTSIAILKNEGYKIKETKSVRNIGSRSASAKIRAEEFNELIVDKKVKLINFATGGDYMFEILPYLNMDNIKANPKWLMGLSDPTNLTYLVTTNFDIATLYGHNATGYGLNVLKNKDVPLNIIKGKINKQNSYKAYFACKDVYSDNYNNPLPVKWLANKKEIDVSGRCIGGCFEVIATQLGTPYDSTIEFVDKYKQDGIIWYFDIFNTNSFNFYLQLLQMKYRGYFKYCKAVIVGRIAFETIESNITYHQALRKIFGTIPIVEEADIGHTKPTMTFINGAIMNLKYKDNKASINFKLK